MTPTVAAELDLTPADAERAERVPEAAAQLPPEVRRYILPFVGLLVWLFVTTIRERRRTEREAAGERPEA